MSNFMALVVEDPARPLFKRRVGGVNNLATRAGYGMDWCSWLRAAILAAVVGLVIA